MAGAQERETNWASESANWHFVVKVLGLMKDRCAGISTIQSTVNAARLIRSFVSTHAPIPKPSGPKKKSLAKKRVLTRMARA